HPWESQAVFNPGAVREEDVVHLLYRAVEGENLSTIGYARLDLDGRVLERRPEPVIQREWDIEKQGCEDPRIVPFEGRYLIFYMAYDGVDPDKGENARIVMSETEDFTTFRKIARVGPDVQDKDAMIFPERFDGKIAFIHRIAPNIQIALFDDLEHLVEPEADYWPCHLHRLDQYTVLAREYDWEAIKIGAGPPPLRTEAGWLLIYHGVDRHRTYRAGAALLHENDPYRVIARLPYPILEPEREYEQVGDVNMVVFPEGVVEVNGELLVYYGGADKVVCLAAGNLKHLIEELWKHRL
ncbi:MAG: glycosidase, partial [Calditrichaeota bacterium]